MIEAANGAVWWCCIGLIFNPEAPRTGIRSATPPLSFKKFFALWGTAWGVQKNWVMGVRQGVKSEFSNFVQCTKKIRDIL